MRKKASQRDLVRVTLHLDAKDYQDFDKIANQEDRSAASLIRLAMRDFLINREQDSHKALQVLPVEKGSM